MMKSGAPPDKVLYRLLPTESQAELISEGYHSLVPGLIYFFEMILCIFDTGYALFSAKTNTDNNIRVFGHLTGADSLLESWGGFIGKDK